MFTCTNEYSQNTKHFAFEAGEHVKETLVDANANECLDAGVGYFICPGNTIFIRDEVVFEDEIV